MTIAILAFAVFFLFRCCYRLSAFPAAVNEYREAADVQLTQAILEGDNPYLMQSLDVRRRTPPVLYQYSFLNSLICAAFAFVLGGKIILAHYVVALLSMIGSGILVYRLIAGYSDDTALPALGAMLVLFCHWRFGYLSTTPNSLGIFLTLLTFTCAVKPGIKNRTTLTAFLCVLLFYTKLYFVTIAGAIFIYELLYNRRKAWHFPLMCLFQGALSVLVISRFWPLYYTYSLYFLNTAYIWQAISRFLPIAASPALSSLPGALIAPGVALPAVVSLGDYLRSPVFLYVLQQYGYLLMTFCVPFAILGLSLILTVVRKNRAKHPGGKKKAAGTWNTNPDILHLAVIQAVLQGLCMLVLGRESGQYLSYYLQLWIPYVIVAALICYAVYLRVARPTLQTVLFAAIALVSIYLGYKKLPLHMLTEEEHAAWEQAQRYVDMYETPDKNSQNVYYSPLLAYMAMEKGKYVYNNGHTGVMQPAMRRIWKEDQKAHTVFPHAGEIIKMHFAYQDEIVSKIREHAYTLVTTDEEGLYVDEALLLENGYRKTDTLALAAGNAVYEVAFWIPEETL